MLSFSTLLAFITFALSHLFKLQWQRNAQKPKQPSLPPGPKPWPIVGNLPKLIINKKKTSVSYWIHSFMKEMNTKIVYIRLGNVHVIPVTCSEISLQFMRKQDAIFASRPLTMATDVLSKGHLTTIFSPLGDQWRKMKRVMMAHCTASAQNSFDIFLLLSIDRTMSRIVRFFLLATPFCWGEYGAVRNRLMPCSSKYSMKAVKVYSPPLSNRTDLIYVLNQCKNGDEGGLVDLRLVARHYCCNVIKKLIFKRGYLGEGKADGGPGFEEEEYVDAILTLVIHLYSFCISDYWPFLRGLDLEGHEKIVADATRVPEKYNNPIEIMIAAVDNPSNNLEWALDEMLNKPETLQMARDELDNVVGKHRLIQESDVPQLNFTKACAREAFRLLPVATFSPPHVSVTDTIVGDYFIPKGSHVIVSRVRLSQNPKVWDEPCKFKPERHLQDCNKGEKVVLEEPDLRLFTFDRGRRGCLGVVLGSLMTAMLLARLLQGFDWSIPTN
ncbi:hypothetical protein V6Z12_D07G220400 [Gossypium hirsutum]